MKMGINKGKFILNMKNELNDNFVLQQMIKIEELKNKIKERGILKVYLELFESNIISFYKWYDDEFVKDYTSSEIFETLEKKSEIDIEDIDKLMQKVILQAYDIVLKKNLIYFKLELYMPKLKEISMKELIIWILYVEINETKLINDKSKQFYYLISKVQKASSIKDSELDLLELLKKIQLYIKHAR